MVSNGRGTTYLIRQAIAVAALICCGLLIGACVGVAPAASLPAQAELALPTTAAQPDPPQTPDPSPSPIAAQTSAAPTPTPEPTATVTPTPTLSPTATPTATATATLTPGPTPDGASRTLRVPILMYHYVSVPPAKADIYRRDLSVSPEQFDAQLSYLRDQGYTVISLDDLLYALAQGRTLPEKPVILTFDDGYEDNYTNAFPILSKHGVMAHFFIISDFVNAGREGYMTWPQIEEMAAAGQRFGSHSRDHPNLSGQPVDYLVWQALGGAEAIQEHLGYHPRWIAYPSGQYDERTSAVYASANYWGGLTTHQGATHTFDGIFELDRVRVRGSHSPEDLGALLALDW
jgi:peptidoglycan/xylan/chitin deacetylase (PgdA/CDA1 family)